jgi:hypothetical protein
MRQSGPRKGKEPKDISFNCYIDTPIILLIGLILEKPVVT